MPRTQWINLPPADDGALKQSAFVGDGVDSADVMGREIFLEAEFDNKEAAALATLKVEPDGDNAKYAPEESGLASDMVAKINVTEKGVARFAVKLSSAGGDKFKLVVKDKEGTEKKSEEIETRRALYYQVIRMKGMTATEATLVAHLESEFWNTGKKHYIKLNKIASKGEIDGPKNFDRNQIPSLSGLAKAQYNDEKDPFCFALLLVNQLAISDKAEVTSGVVTVKKGATVTLSAGGVSLWLDLDDAATPEAKWLLEDVVFVDEKTSAETKIDPKRIKPPGAPPTKTFVVDLADLPEGAEGTVKAKVKIVDFFATGASLGKNVICVATRTQWKQREDDAMKSTVVHEAGHKIGMVPDGTGGLKKQSTFYLKEGRHCNHGGDTCVMYGQIHPGRGNEFCSVCKESVRRLNLDATKLPGFSPL